MLWGWSVWAAVGAVVLLIGLLTVFSTPGDKATVPGIGTILLTRPQFVAALAAAFAWPAWVVVAAILTQLPWWRWLRTARLAG